MGLAAVGPIILIETRMKKSTRCWAVVPAAGTGSRMGADIPKQYLPLAGGTIIEQTLRRLASSGSIAGIVVAVGAGDERWKNARPDIDRPLITVTGGAERYRSVLNAVEKLLAMGCGGNEWVLVHDAVRPCIRTADIEKLVVTLWDSREGGVLAAPVNDTIKRGDETGNIIATVERNRLWRALTPQMFRLRPLHDALAGALAARKRVTDEASAMELSGYRPRLVEGHADNIKITRPTDLAMAEFLLRQQDERPCA